MDSPKPSRRPEIRLQKYLAECGFGSRRACEKLIDRGLVEVDGARVTEQGVRVDLSRQEVRVQGRVAKPQNKVYYLLNKPRGYLCTSRDTRGRPVCIDLLPSCPSRVYTVGRLDMDSDGLLLITNDGELAHRMTHPRYELSKTYRVRLRRPLTPLVMQRLTEGIDVDGEIMSMDRIYPEHSGRGPDCYHVVMHEGKNRQIRRMIRAEGNSVRRLTRLSIGPLKLGSLKPGRTRMLTPGELSLLYEVVHLS